MKMSTPVSRKNPYIPEERFNFGIRFLGNRAVFQVDFVDRKMLLIRRGELKKSFTFRQYESYQKNGDSGVTFQFTTERLAFRFDDEDDTCILQYLMDIVSGIVGRQLNVSKNVPNVDLPSQTILKEYIVEKRGNTSLPTWDKRVLQIRQNEICYFKPGWKLPLNVCRIWYENYNFYQTDKGELKLSVKNETHRNYIFRSVSGKSEKISQSDFKEWSNVFKRAFVPKRYVLQCLSYPEHNGPSECMSARSLPRIAEDRYAETGCMNARSLPRKADDGYAENKLILDHLTKSQREILGSKIQNVLAKIQLKSQTDVANESSTAKAFDEQTLPPDYEQMSEGSTQCTQSTDDTTISDDVFYENYEGKTSRENKKLQDTRYPDNYRLTLAVEPTELLQCAQKDRVKPPSLTKCFDT